jgi:hypothetical protein
MKLFLLLILLLAFLNAYNQPAKVERKQFPEWEQKHYANKLHYHGIWIAICEEDDCYFFQDGGKCRL